MKAIIIQDHDAMPAPSPSLVERLRAIDAKMTHGPMGLRWNGQCETVVKRHDDGTHSTLVEFWSDDAEPFVELRNSLPAIIAALKSAQRDAAELERLRRELNHAVYLSDKRAEERDAAEREVERLRAVRDAVRHQLSEGVSLLRRAKRLLSLREVHNAMPIDGGYYADYEKLLCVDDGDEIERFFAALAAAGEKEPAK